VKAPVAALVVLSLAGGCAAHAGTTSPSPGPGPTGRTTGQHQHTASATPSETTFDRHRYSLTDPSSIWVIVNKTHPISPLSFTPRITLVRGYQVATAAAAPLARLLDAADRAAVHLKIASAYRSFAYQEGVHAHLVNTLGQEAADAISARPGYSEHQTGLAVDLQTLDGTCALDPCFVHTRAGRWLAVHAWRFGFVIRYTATNSHVTGYSPEPWHFRYVGPSLARELHRSGVGSLEQFFGVRGGEYPTGSGS
jgi:zinc D-Ala-D-Ala carboxypeptidase